MSQELAGVLGSGDSLSEFSSLECSGVPMYLKDGVILSVLPNALRIAILAIVLSAMSFVLGWSSGSS